MTLADAHVHYYPCYEIDYFLDSAVANFQRAAKQLGVDHSWHGCLLFTDCDGQDSLRLFKTAPVGSWTFRPTDETDSLVACHENGLALTLVSGRQIITKEQIEVLALGCSMQVPDGLSLAATIEAAQDANATPVIPWGFGKWWGRRGKIIHELLASKNGAAKRELFLGDSGGRTRLLGRPSLFHMAENRQIQVLPGSDPLPLASHVSRAGSFGFVLPSQLDLNRPAEQFKEHLGTIDQQPQTYGRLERFDKFIRNQMAMQFRKIRKHTA